MDLPDLIAALSRPDAYPHPTPGGVAVRQTHVSAVFLAGDFAYKVKKPVDLGFLDFTTLDRRRHFCDEETRLNRRLAPTVYLGVVPVTSTDDGVRVGGIGEPVEWAVKMARLPDEASLLWHVRHGDVTADQLAALARRIADFHRAAEATAITARFGRFDVVAGNARENFDQARGQVGATVSRPVFDRLRRLTESCLSRLRPLIEARADRGVPRDTHGDLRLDHVYLLPDGFAVIDCIEFAERFRYADPISDVAFLAMDLAAHGREDLAAPFVDAFVRASGDAEGRQLLPFYEAYRAMVRGKVEGMKAAEPEVAAADREAARVAARRAWLHALRRLAEAAGEPAPRLVLVGGLPGAGKSTLARGLAADLGAERICSDVVRKELAAGGAADLYTPEWTERTYAECLRRAEALLFDGTPVVVDATFREDRWRARFLAAAGGLGLPGALLLCEADPDTVRRRLAARRGDVSDADWAVHVRLAGEWEPLGPAVERAVHRIDTTGDADETRRRAVRILAG